MKTAIIVENLKKYNPEKVILFGSWVWGKPKKDSDIDLLIVKDTKKNPYKRMPEARKFLHGIDFPFDVLVFTPKEIEERLRANDFFISEIINKGKVLYETGQE
ncbi:MAG: nucleotidyltransferase domain-containing protein [Candidatus Moranbacteria bacterium]|nr:nucleotidyltransferase domain-containing protein [Candidatus Moranbacteria bacterium]